MLSLPKDNNILPELYDNKQRILNQLTMAKSEFTKKKLLSWIDKIDKLIQEQYDKAS